MCNFYYKIITEQLNYNVQFYFPTKCEFPLTDCTFGVWCNLIQTRLIIRACRQIIRGTFFYMNFDVFERNNNKNCLNKPWSVSSYWPGTGKMHRVGLRLEGIRQILYWQEKERPSFKILNRRSLQWQDVEMFKVNISYLHPQKLIQFLWMQHFSGRNKYQSNCSFSILGYLYKKKRFAFWRTVFHLLLYLKTFFICCYFNT